MELTRRNTIGIALSAAILPSATGHGARPNILWIVSEDNNPFIGAYGDHLARTPNIDALARRGLLFEKAYSAAPVCAPSRFALITGAAAESNAPAIHMRASSHLPESWRTTPEFMRDLGYYCTNNAKTDYNCDIDPARVWNESGEHAHWRRRADRHQPFFSVFNSMTTHESRLFTPTPGAVRASDVPLPDYLPDTPEMRGDYASYYNLMEKMDAEVGARLAELEADGLAEDTIVFYYSDNGGVLPRSKRHCYEEGLRIALVVAAPPKWQHLLGAPAGSRIGAPVGLIDLPPTIIALAGGPRPAQMQGQSLFPWKRDRHEPVFGARGRMDERFDFVRTVTDGRWRYVRNYMPHLPSGQVQAFAWQAKGYQSWDRAHRAGTLTAQQDRFFQPRPFEELFDLETDPDELRNRADDPAAEGELNRLRRALDRHMRAINDNGFIPEGSPIEGHAASRSPNAYPLARVMALAERAARRLDANLPVFVKLLGDSSEIIRYWAALGLVMLGRGASPAAADLEACLERETSPRVMPVLAEALAHGGREDKGVPVLAALTAEANDPRVRLYALHALTGVGPAALPALAEIALAAKSSDQYVARAALYLELSLTGRYEPSVRLSTGEGSAK